ncbi:RCC1 and BTB domain-containing protein 1, variant 4 [Dermatophagoides farinae]|uniref:RCC1 and BTB domain-containing protein 1, variant 4 n=1 Tax=Dermatophagoides farinae TaxID=6954 RepID=A0A922HQU9_DERFA|nr:RCC1 and BTB domain-containing protein 1, variant 4 [Dermatophagoides farinae]
MARLPNENIDIELFQDAFKYIDQEFLISVVSIFSFTFNVDKQFLLMTKGATYTYVEEKCSSLSLKHDMSKLQRISLLDDMKIVQVDSCINFLVILTDDGLVYLASDFNLKTNSKLKLIPTDNDRFKMIACGWEHFLLLRQDGHVFAMGFDIYGQIMGNEKSWMIHIENQENVERIFCGFFNSFSITNKGEIYSWGLNNGDQLGFGDQKDKNTPCLVTFPNDLVDTRIKDIVASNNYSLFLFENGQLWGCGSNSDGQLGLGDQINQSNLTKIPIENVQKIACSKFDRFSLAYDGSSYYAWGKTKYGNWSSPKRLDDHLTSLEAASAMILSSPITFGLTSTIYVFGSLDSISYQCKSIIKLFDNHDSYDVEFLIDKKRIKASKCYLKSVSEYYRRMFSGNWSENDQVTINDYSYDTYYAYLRMLHTDKIHTNRQNIAELVDLANCYGDERLMEYCEKFISDDLTKQTMSLYLPLINKYEMKELGYKIGNITRSLTENIDIDLFQYSLKKIDRKFLRTVVSIFSFLFFVIKKEFVLMTKESTYAYGEEICSWLSLEHDMTKPQRISCLDDMKIVQVDYGRDFFAILTHDGQVFLASDVKSKWKTNKTLRLINTGNDCFKMIACGWMHLLLLRQDGHVFAMGDNSRCQITGHQQSSFESMIHIDKLENVERITCGLFHSFSITNKGEIYSWGSNDCGQLGHDDKKNRNTPCLVSFPNDDSTRINDIAANYQHSLFLFENGQLWGCGSNENGQLGLGFRKFQSYLTKIPIENVQQIACSKSSPFLPSVFSSISLAYDGSSYYAWGKTSNGIYSSPIKLCYSHSSFLAASATFLSSPDTFGLTSIIHEFKSHDPISYQCKSIIKLFDNQDSYDVEFIIDKKRIKACKCYLKSASEYYRRMFSGNWSENDQVPIENYSYDTYYAYLRMLHTGKIHINRQNITELVDLANCYGDERLMKYCETFIRSDLNEQTMPTFLPLINKYEMKELKRRIGMAKTSVEKTWPCVTDLFSGPDKNFGLVHHFRSRTVRKITRTHGLCDKWRGQIDWQWDNWENHIKVYAIQAIIKSSPRVIFAALPF